MRIFVDLSKENGALGDIITLIPTIRALKKKYHDRDLIVIAHFENIKILSYCNYVNYIVPVDILTEEWQSCVNLMHDDKVFSLKTSFLAQHRDHIVKAPIKEIANLNPDNESLEFELSIKDYDIPIIEKHKNKLLKLAGGKKIVGISPAISMYSRMYPQAHWQKLTNILIKNGYFVVSLGHGDDLDINVDFDSRGIYAIQHVPKILDIFEAIFVINSGMMHLAGINQNVHLVLINPGQFPAKLIAPYRHGKFGYNTTIIEHNCPIFDRCFNEYVSQEAIYKQCQEFVSRWEQEIRKQFPPEEMPFKYTCWNYCSKENDKFVCSNLDPEVVFKAFKEKESVVIPVSSQGLPVFHGSLKDTVEDYKKWKDVIMLKSKGRIFVNILDTNISNIYEKMRCVSVLYPNHTLVVIGRKKHIPMIKNCSHVHCILPIELISKSLKFRKEDIMLKI